MLSIQNHTPFHPDPPCKKKIELPLKSNSFENLCSLNLVYHTQEAPEEKTIKKVSFHIPSETQMKKDLLIKKMRSVSRGIFLIASIYTGAMLLTMYPEKKPPFSKENQTLITSIFIGSLSALLGNFALFFMRNRECFFSEL
jgi:hypothetical protein